MSKALLVALREFMENLRTKTFWIGILAFPVIWGLAIGMSILFAKTKEARSYAVVDQSSWLHEEIKAQTAASDLNKLFSQAATQTAFPNPDFGSIPPLISDLAPHLAQFDKDQLRLLSKAVTATKGNPVINLDELSAEHRDPVMEQKEKLVLWWKNLDTKGAAALGGSLTKSKFRLVDFGPSVTTEELNKKIADQELFSYFVIGKDPVASPEGCAYVSQNLTDNDLKNWFQNLATRSAQQKRVSQVGLDQKKASWIQERLTFANKKLGEEGEEEAVQAKDKLRQFAPVAFVYILWITVFMAAQMLLTNTVEEKSNRIIEVLLSSVSPLQLMTGKILGIAATGLTVVGSWAAMFLGSTLLMASGGVGLGKDLDLGKIAMDPVFMISFLVYFLLGYLLYSAILVAIGSVCNSLKEAQNLMQPVVIMLMVPLLTMLPIIQDPNSKLAKIMSYIPLYTPFVMMNRAAAPPTLFEYIVTTIILILSIAAAFWGAAKIFRVGVLMTGKPPGFKDLFRMLKAPVGAIPERTEKK